MTNEIYDNLSAAKDKLVELQTAVEAVTLGFSSKNIQAKLVDLMAEYGRFTAHLESIVECVDDSLDELDRLNQENEEQQKLISEMRDALQPRSFRNANYLEHHESREELQEEYKG